MRMARGGTGGGVILLVGAALLALVGVGWACLITNCPRGGKRSGGGATGMATSAGRTNRELQCAPCGPGGEGMCVGPGICCSPLFGCLLAVRGTCNRAVAFPPHCAAPAPTSPASPALNAVPLDAPCGADLTPDGSAPGRCAALGVCCTHDSCRLDAACQSRDDNNDAASPLSIPPAFDTDFLLASIRRLGGANAN